MKKLLALLMLTGILITSCSSQKYGCPGSNYYSKDNKKQNSKAGKQMQRLF
ncbi:hypothetical protein [Chitinophaga defluvii]|uniref:Lipoprotein n=1 Tax=Chitinophaga defluvii TaxID=3163343 RepID=A0ABV2TAH7_9BACT